MASLDLLRVAVFEGAWNLPLWIGQQHGIFRSLGLAIDLFAVPNSVKLIAALYEDEVQIALAGADNFVAYQASAGETTVARTDDLRIVMGGDAGFLSLMARPDITSFAALRGRTLAVDAMQTGFAFVLREMLRREGIEDAEVTIVSAGGTDRRYRALCDGQCDATLLRTPFETLAQRQGCHRLAGTEFLAAYQGTAGAVRRRWAHENEASLIAFLRGYHLALQWCLDPRHRAAVGTMLQAHLPDLTVDVTDEVVARLLHPFEGLRFDMQVDLEGLQTVLDLRERFATAGSPLKAPGEYVDAHYLARALDLPTG